MINSKNDLKYYLEQDRKALNKDYKNPKFLRDYIWKYEIYLRKSEYFLNCKNGFFGKVFLKYYLLKMSRTGRKNGGFSIPLNADSGLSLAHYGSIIVNNGAKLGKNCRIHEGVTIGATNGSTKAATIGNNVFIGTGAKIIGEVTIGDCATIGANSVVTHSFVEPNCVLVGVPAKKIAEDSSKSNLSPMIR